MKLQDYHFINKDCIVEILYGEHRTFLVQKTFKVVRMCLDTPQDIHGRNTFIVDVYGKELPFLDSSLKLIEKPGYTKVSAGNWIADYLVK